MTDIYINYGPLIVMPILAAMAWAYVKLTTAKFRATSTGEILSRAGVEISGVVLMVKQTYVDAIREGRADGKLTQEEKDEALDRALEALKANYGIAGLSKLAKILGLDSVEDWLLTHVEAVLQDTPKAFVLGQVAETEEGIEKK